MANFGENRRAFISKIVEINSLLMLIPEYIWECISDVQNYGTKF
jgi:hypothetical protein